MKTYMVIAKVNGVDYLTKVTGDSEINAEHKILDMGVCNKYGYGVEACIAYDYEAMETVTFRSHALNAEIISLAEFANIVSKRNIELRKREDAEKEITRIEKEIKELEKRLEEQKKILEQ